MSPRRWLVLGFAVVAVTMGIFASRAALEWAAPDGVPAVAVDAATSPSTDMVPSASDAGEKKSGAAVDLSGTWRFDPEHSDLPMFGGRRGGPRGGMGPGGGMRRGGGEGGGGPEGWRRDSSRAGRGGGRGRLGGRLPNLIEISEDTGAVTIADSTGEPFAEIRFDGTAPKASSDAPSEEGPRVVAGTWSKGVLRVDREGWNGMKLTQTFSLEDGGKTLVIRNPLPAFGDRPAREVKRVYRRVASS